METPMTLRIAFAIVILTFAEHQIQVTGYQQEISLYNTEGGIFTFHTDVPSLTANFLGTINRTCARGFWILYREEDYWSLGGIINSFNEITVCVGLEHFPYLSLRRGGSVETTEDVISIFSSTSYQGNVSNADLDEPAFLDDFQGQSFIQTGPSGWTIYEGQNFTGKSVCTHDVLEDPSREVVAVDDVSAVLQMDKIESVKKGCSF